MSSVLKKLPFIIVPVAFVAVVLLYGSNIVGWITQGSGQTQETVPIPVPATPAAYVPFTELEVDIDTPPLEPARYGHEAVVAIADAIDGHVRENQGGMLVFVAFITHASRQNFALS